MEPPVESSEELSPKNGYALWASCYDHDGNPLLPLEEESIASMLGGAQGLRVLDLGCGTGRHTLSLARKGAIVTALDQSPEMMAIARQKAGNLPVTWIEHSLPDPLPLKTGSFERVVLGLVAEHVEDLSGLLSEVSRVLTPGGQCILSAFHPDRTAEGQRARFIDPESGERRPITTYHRTIEEYHGAALGCGMVAIAEEVLVVPPDHATLYPRAARYIGLALGWVGCWEKARDV